MNDYLQPAFYRFNADSLKLVKWLVSLRPACTHLLDLGAGCGVIGIELSNDLEPSNLTLVEAQKEFLPYLKNNIRTQLKTKTKVEIIEASFGEWKAHSRFDLIVCNPPYYLKGHGQEAQDQAKHMARTFMVDDWAILLSVIENTLTRTGKAFLVVKNDQRILKEVANAPGL